MLGYSVSSTFLFSAFSQYPKWFEDRVSIGVSLGTTVKLTNTEDEALIVAADYYSLQLDDYLYDFVAESGEFCWENTWICLTAGALIIEDGESLN